VITTGTVNDTGGYIIAKQLYDSLGRPAETQTATLDGGRDITDVYYNSDGWKLLESSAYYTTGAPSNTLVAAPDSQVPSQTGYVYDGAGRITRQIAYKFATETWETDTAYGGNYTTVTPPAGGTPQTTYTDGRGLTSYIYQYHSATPPASPPAPGSGSVTGASGWDQTAYTHTPAGQLASITDAAGNTWTDRYNLAGDQTGSCWP
jgi:YD repeat-containing protein